MGTAAAAAAAVVAVAVAAVAAVAVAVAAAAAANLGDPERRLAPTRLHSVHEVFAWAGAGAVMHH